MAMAYKGSLIELPLFGTYWVYKYVYNVGNHLVIQSMYECHVRLPFG